MKVAVVVALLVSSVAARPHNERRQRAADESEVGGATGEHLFHGSHLWGLEDYHEPAEDRKKKVLLEIIFSMAPIFGVWRTTMSLLRTERRGQLKKKVLLEIIFSMDPIFGVWRITMSLLRTERRGLLKKKVLLEIIFSMEKMIFGVWRTT